MIPQLTRSDFAYRLRVLYHWAVQGRAARVSIIVVNYNGMSYIETCLRSILRQSFRDFEIIVVDNCSSDGSLDYLRQAFPDLKLVANEQNRGYSGGINSGLAHAAGEYLAPLNVDTEVEPDWLAAMVEFMDANPEAGAATPKSLLYRDRTRIGVQGLDIHITGLGFVRGLNQPDTGPPAEPFQVAGVSGCSYIIRRNIVEQMGGLNEDNFMYYDDVDLSWMVNLMGYRIYCVPQSVVYHEYELRMTPQKMYWLEYGRLSSLLSYFRLGTLLLISPAVLLTEVQITGYCLIRGPVYLRAKFAAIVAVMRSLRTVVQRRRLAQRLRRLSDYQLLKRFELRYEWGQVLRTLN